MEKIYFKHRDNIKTLFHEEDINFILRPPLTNIFNEAAIMRIMDKESEKVNVFFEEFDKLIIPVKYMHFIDVTIEVSEWIAAFLISEDDGDNALRKFNISVNLINQNNEFFIDNLNFNVSVIRDSLKANLITSRTSTLLTKILIDDGDLVAKYRFHTLIHVYSLTCYAKFLFLCSKHCRVYLELFYTDLDTTISDSGSDEEIISCIDIIISSELENYKNDPTLYKDVPPVPDLSPLDSDSEFHIKIYGEVDDSSDDNKDSEIDFDNVFGEYKNKSVAEMINFQSETVSPNESTLEIREYQNELAQRGVEGKNVLICAPTSSGKTVVAIKIAEEHMKKNPSGKVALVVPTTVLVDQQFNLFRKILGKNYKINKLSGGTKSFSVPLSAQVKDYDIFVFTCDILKNALEDQDEPLRSISELSLIIFDECHHCDKDHSYNKVMDHYFKDKEADKPLPQIIGMTASTGTDKAKNVEAALNSLVSLCGNLDCESVSTVMINIDELNKNLPTPSNEIKLTEARSKDRFENQLISLMESTERKLAGIFRPKNQPIGIPSDRYHDKYLSFVKGITNHFPNLLDDEERKGVKIIEIYLEHFHRALIINHLFNRCHAMNILQEKIDTKTPCTCDVDGTLRELFNEFMSTAELEQDVNPCLEYLKEEIKKQMKEDRKSKIIVFVKEVQYTRILENEIQLAKLGFIQCKALVGTNKSSDQGGLSKSESEEIVSRFRRGIINLIFATSVAEEGLDVEQCNLVIRYGHVTNEIAMVQCRGRARALNSKYIVIVPRRFRWQVNKENVNKVRETMMYKAIEQFQQMHLNDLKKKLFESQEKRHALRSVAPANNNVELVSVVVDNSNWELHCNKCNNYICSSKDLRLANGTSYIIVNKLTYCNLKVTKSKKNNYPILCSKCLKNLGYAIKVDGFNVPNIKISECILQCGLDRVTKKKWKDVPFGVPVVGGTELSDCQSDIFDVMNG